MTSIWRIEPRFRDHRMAELLDSYEAAEDFVVSRSGFKPWADCQTFPIDVDGKRFFIKYYRHQKAWWRALGRSRARRELGNMEFFDTLGVPTTPPAVYGEERIFGLYGKGGIIVTEGLENCTDMHALGNDGLSFLAIGPGSIGCAGGLQNSCAVCTAQGFVTMICTGATC